MQTRNVYVAGSMRIPFVKSLQQYLDVSTQDMMIAALQGLVDKLHLSGKLIGDTALGAVMTGPQNWNLARECVLGTTLDPHSPGYTLQRACGTSLEATKLILELQAVSIPIVI
jgi:acetyl-CoA C-acetyltransferase